VKQHPNIKIRIHQSKRMSEIEGTGLLKLVHRLVFRTKYNVSESKSVFETVCSVRNTKRWIENTKPIILRKFSFEGLLLIPYNKDLFEKLTVAHVRVLPPLKLKF
jgi:hypothetical protein